MPYQSIIAGLNKYKARQPLSIHKIEDAQPTLDETVEIKYGKASIIVNSAKQLQLVLKALDNV